MLTSRLLVLSLIAALAGSGIAVAASGLSKRAIDSSATIYFTQPDQFGVKVNSSDERCLPRRVVRFRKVRIGPDRTLFSKETKASGWAIREFNPPRGSYYGRVADREAQFGTCAGVRTGTTTISE